MTGIIDQLPPWEGPDLLAEAKAAALKAGQSLAVSVRPAIRFPAVKPKERTWADVEATFPSVLGMVRPARPAAAPSVSRRTAGTAAALKPADSQQASKD